MKKERTKKIHLWNEVPIVLFVKSFLSLMFATLLAIRSLQTKKCMYFTILELGIVFFITLIIKSKRISYIINSILTFIILIQHCIMFFGGTYLTYIMLTNVEAFGTISGKMDKIIPIVLSGILISFMPIRYKDKAIKLDFVNKRFIALGLVIVLGIDIASCYHFSIGYSPIASMGYIAKTSLEERTIRKKLEDNKIYNKKNKNNKKLLNEYDRKFYSKNIKGYRAKDSVLTQNPNIILLFTEGLSQNIIDDPRNIMPNIRKFQQKTLNVQNYYNHTAATYRGITGQLYSGYQFYNTDSNRLPSLQSILKKRGYTSLFINPEPTVDNFVNQLKSFGFDNFISTDVKNNDIFYHKDSEMYNKMFAECKELNKRKKPFFASMYTFQTHCGVDVSNGDKMWGDGTVSELNKFHNLDYQFGKFMKKFKKSKMSDNTIVIFTTDHCTYADDEYTAAFGANYYREANFCDKMPLSIWYKGIKAETIDAGGRNSLDLAPTICDLLDISDENYFLGQSLFGRIEDANVYETIYADPQEGDYKITKNNSIQTDLTSTEYDEIDKLIKEYLAGT